MLVILVSGGIEDLPDAPSCASSPSFSPPASFEVEPAPSQLKALKALAKNRGGPLGSDFLMTAPVPFKVAFVNHGGLAS